MSRVPTAEKIARLQAYISLDERNLANAEDEITRNVARMNLDNDRKKLAALIAEHPTPNPKATMTTASTTNNDRVVAATAEADRLRAVAASLEGKLRAARSAVTAKAPAAKATLPALPPHLMSRTEPVATPATAPSAEDLGRLRGLVMNDAALARSVEPYLRAIGQWQLVIADTTFKRQRLAAYIEQREATADIMASASANAPAGLANGFNREAYLWSYTSRERASIAEIDQTIANCQQQQRDAFHHATAYVPAGF